MPEKKKKLTKKQEERRETLRWILQDQDCGRFYSHEQRMAMTDELEKLEGVKIPSNGLWAAGPR